MDADDLEKALNGAREFAAACLVQNFQSRVLPCADAAGEPILGLAIKEHEDADPVVFLFELEDAEFLANQLMEAAAELKEHRKEENVIQ